MPVLFLFDQKIRTLDGPATYNADTYEYYNNSTRAEVGNVRELLELWFSLYPDDEKEELKSRFKASFDPTFFELYIFVLFSKLGYKLEIHPQLSSKTTRPDYLATKGKERIYIEVKYMTMRSQDEQSFERRKNELLNALNKIDSRNFLLNIVSILFKESSQPNGKAIIRHFNKKVSSCDPDVYTNLLNNGGIHGMPKIVYEDDKVKIEVSLLPKLPIHRGANSRAIGLHSVVTQYGNDSDSIVSSLEVKATRYGHLKAPFIICLNKQAVSFDPIELQEALYGSWQVSWSENPTDRDEKLEFDGTGFFGSKENQKFTRVSGVYFTNVNSANLASTVNHAFRHNPFAKYPLDFVIKESVPEILSIPESYPYNMEI